MDEIDEIFDADVSGFEGLAPLESRCEDGQWRAFVRAPARWFPPAVDPFVWPDEDPAVASV